MEDDERPDTVWAQVNGESVYIVSDPLLGVIVAVEQADGTLRTRGFLSPLLKLEEPPS